MGGAARGSCRAHLVGTARSIAATWRVPIEFVGDAGHINAAAGVGDWPQGHKLLRAFVSSS